MARGLLPVSGVSVGRRRRSIGTPSGALSRARGDLAEGVPSVLRMIVLQTHPAHDYALVRMRSSRPLGTTHSYECVVLRVHKQRIRTNVQWRTSPGPASGAPTAHFRPNPPRPTQRSGRSADRPASPADRPT